MKIVVCLLLSCEAAVVWVANAFSDIYIEICNEDARVN